MVKLASEARSSGSSKSGHDFKFEMQTFQLDMRDVVNGISGQIECVNERVKQIELHIADTMSVSVQMTNKLSEKIDARMQPKEMEMMQTLEYRQLLATALDEQHELMKKNVKKNGVAGAADGKADASAAIAE